MMCPRSLEMIFVAPLRATGCWRGYLVLRLVINMIFLNSNVQKLKSRICINIKNLPLGICLKSRSFVAGCFGRHPHTGWRRSGSTCFLSDLTKQKDNVSKLHLLIWVVQPRKQMSRLGTRQIRVSRRTHCGNEHEVERRSIDSIALHCFSVAPDMAMVLLHASTSVAFPQVRHVVSSRRAPQRYATELHLLSFAPQPLTQHLIDPSRHAYTHALQLKQAAQPISVRVSRYSSCRAASRHMHSMQTVATERIPHACRT